MADRALTAGVSVEAAAAIDAVGGACHGVQTVPGLLGAIRPVPVPAPLPDVAVHVVQPEPVRQRTSPPERAPRRPSVHVSHCQKGCARDLRGGVGHVGAWAFMLAPVEHGPRARRRRHDSRTPTAPRVGSRSPCPSSHRARGCIDQSTCSTGCMSASNRRPPAKLNLPARCIRLGSRRLFVATLHSRAHCPCVSSCRARKNGDECHSDAAPSGSFAPACGS